MYKNDVSGKTGSLGHFGEKMVAVDSDLRHVEEKIAREWWQIGKDYAEKCWCLLAIPIYLNCTKL